MPATAQATQPAPSSAPTNAQANNKANILWLIVEEFRKQKRELVEKRDALLKAGKSPTDPEILDIENKIRKADAYMAQVEDQGAQRGIAPMPPGSQPSAPVPTP